MEMYRSGQERGNVTHPWQVGHKVQKQQDEFPGSPGDGSVCPCWQFIGFNLFVAFDNMDTLGGGALKVHRYVINKND